ncbi:Taurine dioxygenase, alpha-ketoglutarate-dependent [Sphingomonas sp. YR710]|uniref:TauD/TfdA dioxygenase family protein n=1 Tax=Sphingomonas sp. YR710 TaxID=1882773 RepID=UPI000887AB11|nr:TauD/TfdA family dioxygenase [Sphingomonas sp. YR710]SDC89260.1 Taurine dioxygenase, alpha-ketoglutarate-dependent [Sphingomonas sp. YR710]
MVELEVRQLNPLFGAEVIGLEPKVPLDDRTLKTLREMFDKYSVLVFRDLQIDNVFQNYLSYALIGRDVPAPGAVGYRDPEHKAYISNKEATGIAPFGRLLYHSDMMWSDQPCQLLSLYGVDVEEPSQPTVFVSAAHAWKTLPADLRSRIEGRFAEHVHDNSYQRAGGDANVMTAKFADDDKVRLPIGHRHPRTGQMLLYVCQQMTSGIADMPAAESEALLEELFQHLYAPENVFEHHWHKGDLVIWDNLALQHARPNVMADGPARTLRKTFAPMPAMPKIKQPEFSLAGM